ncbi:MAG: SRPBCC family protein [Rubrivivax sp.]|nr:SRPBCC family protein [Rubrivivax sp.]
MEVKLDKRYPVAAGVEQAWAVLADVRATAACMPGAQITEQLDETHYKGTVRSKVGPAVMTFGGEIEVLALDAATRSLRMVGKGADKSGSSAQMDLSAHVEAGEGAGQSVLVGRATITVSGKLAQFGSRLLVPVSDAMLAQFADNFRAAAAAVPAPGAMPAGGDETTVIRMVQGGQQPAPTPGAPAAASPPPPVKELNALALLWTVVKGWFAGLFRRR